eukprot:11645413-Karenia_brevis.AAC.1
MTPTSRNAGMQSLSTKELCFDLLGGGEKDEVDQVQRLLAAVKLINFRLRPPISMLKAHP